MKIAASTVCWMHKPLEHSLEMASKAGFKALEPLTFPKEIFDCHGDLRDLKPAEYRKKFTDHGLELIGLHLGAIQTQTEERRRVLTDYCKRAIDFASEVGCKLIVEGGPDRRPDQKFWPFLLSLEELAEYLKGSDVRIALENHYGNWLQFIQDYEYVFDRIDSPNIGITLDTGHFTSAGVDPEAVARKFTAKIFHVHIKDHRGTHSVALGAGETNNFGMARVLREAGYTGYLSQELEVEGADPDVVAAEGIAYMRRLLEV